MACIKNAGTSNELKKAEKWRKKREYENMKRIKILGGENKKK